MRFKIVEKERFDSFTVPIKYTVYYKKHWWNRWAYSAVFYSKKEAEKYIKYIKENL